MNNLRIGDRGALVELLQTALRRAAYLTAVDGVFGPVTQRAVINFQRDNGLAPDGIVGPLTERALSPWLLGYITHTVRGGDTLYRESHRDGKSGA
jgi:g-D-glutamyl-meso-diaminopimelate peptidase